MVLAVGASNFLGLAQAGAWNSVTSMGSRVDMPMLAGGLKQVKPPVFSKQTRGLVKRFGRYGHSQVEGDINTEWFAEGYSKLLTAGLARTTVSGTNFNTHTFGFADATGTLDNPFGLVVWTHQDLKTWRSLSCFAKSYTWTFSDEPFVSFKTSMIGASRTREAAVTPSFSSLAPMTGFGDGSTVGLIISAVTNAHTYANVLAKSATITINTGIDLAKAINTAAPVKPMITDKRAITGSWTWNYSSNDALSEDYLTDWDAGTVLGAISFTLIGDVIPGSSPSTRYTLQINIPSAYITGEDPIVSGSGAIDQTFGFEGAIATLGGTAPTVVVKSFETLP